MTTPTTELLTDPEIMGFAFDQRFKDGPSYIIGVVRAAERALLARLGEQQPAFWVRWRTDGPGFDGPLHDSVIEDVRKRSGAWSPLYALPPAAQPVAQGEREALSRVRTAVAGMVEDPTKGDAVFRCGSNGAVRQVLAIIDAEAARSAAQGAVQVPAGWALVPLEPTDAMLDVTTTCHKGRLYPQDNVHGPRAMRRREYVAMLAAAPAHAGERQGDSA